MNALTYLLDNRKNLENKLRTMIGRPVMVIELDFFALPCGCTGITANTRGLELDDLEVFEPQMLPFFEDFAKKQEIKSNIIFARLVPGSSIVASLNWRALCTRCYGEFAGGTGRNLRPDLYILRFEK